MGKFTELDVSSALEWALYYRRLGLVPLPSHVKRKSPALDSYIEYRTEVTPDSMYTADVWRTPNIQLLTGTRVPKQACGFYGLRILVVDLDGVDAQRTFRQMIKEHKTPRLFWCTASPSGGRHVYFEIPDDVENVTTRMVWGAVDNKPRKSSRPRWLIHHEIKILGDGALVVAPPSIHIDFQDERGHYVFVKGFSPHDFPRPTIAPDWLLEMPAAKLPGDTKISWSANGSPEDRRGSSDTYKLALSIPATKKIEFLREWGIKFHGPIKPNGWIECHSIDGDDNTPSGGVKAETGIYKDHRSDDTYHFFELGVLLGKFQSVKDCAAWCRTRNA